MGHLLWEVTVPAADTLDCSLVLQAQAMHKLVWGGPQEVCLTGTIEPRISVGRWTDGFRRCEANGAS